MVQKCEFEYILQLLGKKHVLSILRVLAELNPRGFNEIRYAVGVNPKTLTDRLNDLIREGLVRREELHQIPRKVNYYLTAKGLELVQIFLTIQAWNRKYSKRK